MASSQDGVRNQNNHANDDKRCQGVANHLAELLLPPSVLLKIRHLLLRPLSNQ